MTCTAGCTRITMSGCEYPTERRRDSGESATE
jgi:hypothetical protein